MPLGFSLPAGPSAGMGQDLADKWLPLEELRTFFSPRSLLLAERNWLVGSFLDCHDLSDK